MTPGWPNAPVSLDVVDSTMDAARALVAEGVPHGTTVLARHQRRGRGRTGARWDSPAGAGLYATTVLYVAADAPLGALSPCWALACAEGLGDVGAEVQLKWPNDLWVSGHKLGGLLLQREPIGPTGCCVLVGLGINLVAPATAAPPQGGRPPPARAPAGGEEKARTDQQLHLAPGNAADLDAAPPPRTNLEAVRGAPLGPEALWTALRGRCEPAYAAFVAHGLTPALQARYDARHALHGSLVAGSGRAGPVRGTVAGLQPDGALLLHTADGPQLLYAGAVAKVRPVRQGAGQNVATEAPGRLPS